MTADRAVGLLQPSCAINDAVRARRRWRVLLAASMLWLVATGVAATPQGSAFVYQGELRQNDVPVTGKVDLTFSLFDAPLDGTQIGPMLNFSAAGQNAVRVVNGVFTVSLDFGAPAFINIVALERHLQVTVNGVALTPRTRIDNAPYALQAQAAALAYAVAPGSIGAAQIVATEVQKRVTGTCGTSAAISAINVDGSVVCTPVPDRTLTITPGPSPSANGDALRAAVASISATFESPWVLKLPPGNYDLGTTPLELCQSGPINLFGSGRSVTRILASVDSFDDIYPAGVSTCAEVADVTIENASMATATTALLFYAGGGAGRLSHATIKATSTGNFAVGVAVTGWPEVSAILEDSTITAQSSTGRAIAISNGSFQSTYDGASLMVVNVDAKASPRYYAGGPSTYISVAYFSSNPGQVQIDRSKLEGEHAFAGNQSHIASELIVANSRLTYDTGHVSLGGYFQSICAGVVANYNFIAGSPTGTSCP